MITDQFGTKSAKYGCFKARLAVQDGEYVS